MASAKIKNWWDRNLTAAVIAGFAGILGAAVGGFMTYYGNHTLQEQQSQDAARGIARVLSAQLTTAAARFELSLEEKRLILPDTASAVSLSVDDEQLLASNLDPDSWEKVALALLNLQLEREATAPVPPNQPAMEANAGLHVPLEPKAVELDRRVLTSLRASIRALDSLTDT